MFRKSFPLLFLVLTLVAASAGAQEPVRLRALAVSGHQDFVPPIRAQEQGFNERYTDIQVEIDVVMASWPDFQEKFTVMLLGGTAPDLVMGGAGAYEQFVNENIFLPLDKYIARDKVDLNNFFPGPLSATMVNGKYYSLPGGTSTRAVAYNQNMFAENGIAPPRFKWGWYEDVLPIARKLTDREREPHRYGLAFWVWHGAHHLGDIAAIIWGHDGDILNEDQTRFILGNPEGTEAMEFIISLINDYKVFPDNFDALGHFMAANLGMWFAGSWDSKILANAPFDVGWAAQPYGPKADVATGGGGPSYTIVSTTKYPDEAWEFIKFVSSPQGQLLTNDMPSHRGAVPEYLRRTPPYEDREVFVYNLNRSRMESWPARMPEVYQLLNQSGWQDMLTGKIPFRAFIDDVTPRINQILGSTK